MASNIYNSTHMQNMEITAGSTIAAGDIVVVGDTQQAMLCVALEDIANGATGQVGYNCGVTAPKVSAAVFSQGEFLIWDSSEGKFDDNDMSAASGDVSTNAARADADGANAETTCSVWLTGIPGTKTA